MLTPRRRVPDPCPLSASTIALFLNFLSSLAWFCVDASSGSGFGLSILWALLYTPCSFVCWYRPMYKAFRCVFARAAGRALLHSWCSKLGRLGCSVDEALAQSVTPMVSQLFVALGAWGRGDSALSFVLLHPSR